MSDSICEVSAVKLRKGDRVKFSPAWLAGYGAKRRDKHTGKRGTVMGFGRDGHCVSVLFDGQKTREVYAPDFLEVCSEEVVAQPPSISGDEVQRRP